MCEHERVGVGRRLRRSAVKKIFLHECDTNHTRQDEEKNRKNFQEGTKQRTKTGLFFILRREHTLNNCLITTKIPYSNHGITEQNRIPWQTTGILAIARHIQKISGAPS